MSAPLKSVDATGDISGAMAAIGRHARSAAKSLALVPASQKNAALRAMAAAVRAQEKPILAANSEDLSEAQKGGLSGAFLDRLALDPARLKAMAEGIETVASLDDPVG